MASATSSRCSWLIGVGVAILALAVGLFALAAFREDPPTMPVRTQLPNDTPPVKPVDPGPAELATGPGPQLTLTANGSTNSVVFLGWPVLVQVGLFHPGSYHSSAGGTPLLLAPMGRPGSAAVRLMVRDERGEPVTCPFHPAPAPDGPLTLKVDVSTKLTWGLAPEETAALPAGRYQLSVVVDTGNDVAPGSWRGRLESKPVSIRIVPEPAPLSAIQQAQRYELLAVYQLYFGDINGVLRLADEWLQQHPNDPNWLELRGDLFARLGKMEEALKEYGKAYAAFLKKFGPDEDPPFALLAKQRELRRKLMNEKQ